MKTYVKNEPDAATLTLHALNCLKTPETIRYVFEHFKAKENKNQQIWGAKSAERGNGEKFVERESSVERDKVRNKRMY